MVEATQRRIELVYNFNDWYGKGRDAFKVVATDFKYYVDITPEDEDLSYSELLEKYKDKAFTSAAVMYIDDIAGIISSDYKSRYSC